MQKQRDTRIVTFDQDVTRGGIVIGEGTGMPYIKGSKHAIHVNTVEQLRSHGIKMKVEKPDFEKMYAKIKENRAKAA